MYATGWWSLLLKDHYSLELELAWQYKESLHFEEQPFLPFRVGIQKAKVTSRHEKHNYHTSSDLTDVLKAHFFLHFLLAGSFSL